MGGEPIAGGTECFSSYRPLWFSVFATEDESGEFIRNVTLSQCHELASVLHNLVWPGIVPVERGGRVRRNDITAHTECGRAVLDQTSSADPPTAAVHPSSVHDTDSV